MKISFGNFSLNIISPNVTNLAIIVYSYKITFLFLQEMNCKPGYSFIQIAICPYSPRYCDFIISNPVPAKIELVPTFIKKKINEAKPFDKAIHQC